MSSFERNFLNSQFSSDKKQQQKQQQQSSQQQQILDSYEDTLNNNKSSFQSNSGSINNKLLRSNTIHSNNNDSQLRQTSQLRRSSAYQNDSAIRVKVDDQNDFVLEKLQKKNITFISESEYKKEPKCYVCSSTFGQFTQRTHHCRLCAHSCCDACSNKRVNDTRVCDLCFYKLKNLTGERRKKEFLRTMKTHNQGIAMGIKKGQVEITDLNKKVGDQKIKTDQQILDNQLFTRQKEKEIIQLEKEQQILQNQIEEVEQQLAEEQETMLKVNQDFQEVENKFKLQDMKYEQQKSSYDKKYEAFTLLKKQKDKMESSEDFQRLPNYSRAKKYDSIPLSQAIISLDTQYPPSEYYEKKLKNNNEESSIYSHVQQQYSNNVGNRGTSYDVDILQSNNSEIRLQQKQEIVNVQQQRKKNKGMLC